MYKRVAFGFKSFFLKVISIDAGNHVVLWNTRDGSMIFKFTPEDVVIISAIIVTGMMIIDENNCSDA